MNVSRVLHGVFHPVARLARRAAGADALQHRVAALESAQRHHTNILSSILSSLAASNLPREEVVCSVIYQRAARVLGLLSPMDCEGVPFTRVGREKDGGYVMLDDVGPPRVKAAYSFGISNDVSWELDIARRGVDVYLFDHTITRLPENHPRFRYSRLGITGAVEGPLLRTLPTLLERDGNTGRDDLILKLDVEGCEWDVLTHCPRDVLESFSQIIIEFHGLVPMTVGRGPFSVLEAALSHLKASHQCVHVHANNYAPSMVLPGIVLPSALECTFVSRRAYADRLRPCTRSFPTQLDHACNIGLPEMILGRFAPPTNGPV